MSDLAIGGLLSQLSDETLSDLCAAFGLDHGANREGRVRALLGSQATADEIVQDLLDEEERGQLCSALGLEAPAGSLDMVILGELRARQPPIVEPLPSVHYRRPTDRVDRAVAAVLVLLAMLSPLFAPLWCWAFDLQQFHAWLEVQDLLAEAYTETDVDPWGTPWVPYLDGLCSCGPNRVYEGGRGDDVELYTGSYIQILFPPDEAIYRRAPLDYLVGLGLLLATYVAARRYQPRVSGLRELGFCCLLAAPLSLPCVWWITELRFDHELSGYLQGGEGWLEQQFVIPWMLALSGAAIVFWVLCVYALRRAVFTDLLEDLE